MNKNRNLAGAIIGVVLILIGVLSIFGENFSFVDMDMLWPLFMVGIGAAFFIIMVLGDKTRGGLAVPGSILVTIGVILYFMNATNRWEAWSYCWALVVCAVGVGVWINGYWSDQLELRKRGLDTLRSGLILFLIFGVIMEFIFSATGDSRWGSPLFWAILLALVGLYLLVTHLLQVGKSGSERIDLFWPTLMIGVGVFASLSYMQWLPSGNVGRLISLWPLLLIVAGVGLIFRDRSPWIGLILGLLTVAVIFVVGFAGAQLGLKSNVDWFPNIGVIQFGDESRQMIIGSGNQVTEDRQIQGVQRVELAIDADLEIRQGPVETLTVTGDDNILSVLLTNVSGEKLTIRYQPRINVRNRTPLKILLTVKDMRELRLSSSGSVKVLSLTTGDFDLVLSSSCNVNVQSIQADQITTHISSSGDVVIQGNADELNLDISSSGLFQAENLQVQNADVNLTSSGDATLWVVKNLAAHISSSGNIAYYGSPIIRQTLTSSGKLLPKGDR